MRSCSNSESCQVDSCSHVAEKASRKKLIARMNASRVETPVAVPPQWRKAQHQIETCYSSSERDVLLRTGAFVPKRYWAVQQIAAPPIIMQNAAGGFRQFTKSTITGSSAVFLLVSTIRIGFTSLGVLGACWGERMGTLLTSVDIAFSLFCSVLCIVHYLIA